MSKTNKCVQRFCVLSDVEMDGDVRGNCVTNMELSPDSVKMYMSALIYISVKLCGQDWSTQMASVLSCPANQFLSFDLECISTMKASLLI